MNGPGKSLKYPRSPWERPRIQYGTSKMEETMLMFLFIFLTNACK